ncbi:outer membrane exchange protein TraA family protein [Hyalangium rubrum]|uniref:Outer membrane exchange protein TraA family protein n=1 Tax=Hyalangium rubrum TaxID=3103134 RepID=A0ABU5GVL1_9BACT|nr:outer membrane exchange protein TraA family protein [Hyalangium sp. s54d21]MDY7224904.1 outer membrane exchange protein TraA family protein [Hyalangium sp. s54d21]
MLLSSAFRVSLFVLVALGGGLAPDSAQAQPIQVVLTGDPIAPLPNQQGTGLCSASSSSQNPAADFPQNAAAYNAGINAFMETQAGSRLTSVLRTPLDLSNNNSSGMQASYGDFTNAVPGCGVGGCGFAYNGTTTSFATRLRGLLAVPNDWVSQPVHLGFYTDDSVSLTLFDRNQTAYAVITRPPQIGFSAWRTTNSVVFNQPGLYGIEVLYTENYEHAALEMSFLKGAFTDFERPAQQAPVINLRDQGFVLFAPELFYQTERGHPSSIDLTQCTQCERQFVNAPGSSGCAPGTHCNSAALCSPCNTELYCGAACTPCQAATPFCVNQNGEFACAQCRQDSDCPPPDACHTVACSPMGTCTFPSVADGTACPGGTCQDGSCVAVDAGTPDAGSSPDGGAGADAGSSGPDAGGSDEDGGTTPGNPDGSVSGPDGGPSEGTPDSGTSADAGTRPGGGDETAEGGCGCGSGMSALAPLALLGLPLVLRRLRRRQGAR